MTKLLRSIFLITACSSSLFAARNTLAPNLKFDFTLPEMGDYNSFSFLGEVGLKNIRGDGTYGVYFNPRHRIKFTGELLLQDLTYHFIDELKDRWMTQYSVASEYQYLLLHDLVQSIDFNVSYAHAFHRGVSVTTPEVARIAGSDAILSSLGSTINLWDCGYFSYALTYDYIKYHRSYEHPKLASGVGAVLRYNQYLPLGFSLGGEADFRRPFYYYSGQIDWHGDFSSCAVTVGGYVNYTNGRASLPNALAAGLRLSVAIGPAKLVSGRCGRSQEPESFTDHCRGSAFCNLANWSSVPLSMPMVFAIADELP